jgi:hypothetical protein
MELNLTLDFACCICEQSVSVTVRCRGTGLKRKGDGALAAVNVPCPNCGQVNELLFDPGGEVRSVRPFACFRAVPEPSVN